MVTCRGALFMERLRPLAAQQEFLRVLRCGLGFDVVDMGWMAVAGRAGMSDEALACVLKQIEDPRDRAAASIVCQQWRRVDGVTRKSVTIANMYAVSPAALTRRFKRLEEIKLKGMPRAAEFNLLPSDWGGYATPWLREFGRQYVDLHVLQLRRVTLLDSDLALIASSHLSSALHVLHLHKCVGFTTDGLLPIATSCRSLKRLSLEDSDVQDKGGEWLHALARCNSTLEELHFGVLGIGDINVADLVMLVEKCKSLVCLRVGEVEMLDMVEVLRRVPSLQELGAGSCNKLFGGVGEDEDEDGKPISLPKNLKSLSGMWSLMDASLPMILPVAPNLKKLDLQFTLLSCEGHCLLLSLCHALEELQVRNTLRDEGMETLGTNCKKLRKLRVEHDETGAITQRGVIAVAQGCGQLVQLVVYVADICNAALAMVGQGCPRLTDFRVVVESASRHDPDFPLDDGLKLLLKGCVHLTRLAVYLRHEGLTDEGMEYIGTYGHNLKWLLLGCAGESDLGLANLAYRSQRIERLEIRDCPFGEAGLAAAVEVMSSLKYLWVQGYRATESEGNLVALVRPCLNVEVYPPVGGEPGQLLAYYSLAGPRRDGPPELKVFTPNSTQGLVDFS